jgi:hypothetical protein
MSSLQGKIRTSTGTVALICVVSEMMANGVQIQYAKILNGPKGNETTISPQSLVWGLKKVEADIHSHCSCVIFASTFEFFLATVLGFVLQPRGKT